MAQFEISMKNQRGLTVLTDYDIMSNRTAGLTFDERLNLNVDGSTLDFSMLKYLYEASQKVVSTAAMSITYGTVIQLLVNDYRYDFAVTDISYQFMSENIQLDFSTQDLFQFEVSRLGIGYTVEGDTTDPEYLGAQPIDYWARKIVQDNNLNWSYIPIDELNYDILINYNSGAVNQARNNINNDIEEWLELPKTDYSTLNNPVSFECSGSNAYNALKQLASDNELFIWVDYSAHNFGFVPLKSPIFNGYYFNPNNNLQAFSLRGSGNNLVTVLNVTGPNNVNNQEITLMPTLPLSVVNYINSKAWDSSIYYHDFYETIAPDDDEFVNQIQYTPWLENKLINTDFFVSSNILLPSEQHDIQNTLLNPLRIANGHMIVAWTSYLTQHETDLMDVNQNEIQLEALYSSLYGDLAQFYTLLENDDLINIAYIKDGNKYVSIHTPENVHLDITVNENLYEDVTNNFINNNDITSQHQSTPTTGLVTTINDDGINFTYGRDNLKTEQHLSSTIEFNEYDGNKIVITPQYWETNRGNVLGYSVGLRPFDTYADVTKGTIDAPEEFLQSFYLGVELKPLQAGYTFSPNLFWFGVRGLSSKSIIVPITLGQDFPIPVPISIQYRKYEEVEPIWTARFTPSLAWITETINGEEIVTGLRVRFHNTVGGSEFVDINRINILPIDTVHFTLDNQQAQIDWNATSVTITNQHDSNVLQISNTPILPHATIELSSNQIWNNLRTVYWARQNIASIDTVLKRGPATLQPYTVTYETDPTTQEVIKVRHDKKIIDIDKELNTNVLQSIYAVQNWYPTFKNKNLAGLADFMNTSGSRYDSAYQTMLENLYLFRQEWSRLLFTFQDSDYTVGRLYSTYHKIGTINSDEPALRRGQPWSAYYTQYVLSVRDIVLLRNAFTLKTTELLLRDTVIQYFASISAKLSQYWSVAYIAAQQLGIFLPETWDCVDILEEQTTNSQFSQVMLPLYIGTSSDYDAPYWNSTPLINNTLIPLVHESTHYPLQYRFHDDNATPLPTVLDNNHTQLYYQPVEVVDDYHPSYSILRKTHSENVADDNIHLYFTKQRVKRKEYTNADDTPLLSVEQALQRYVVDDLGLNRTLIAKWLQFLAAHMQYNLSTYYQALNQHNNIWQQLYHQYPGIFRESEYVNQNAMNSNELYLAAKRELDKLSKPEFSYNLTGMDIYMHQSDFIPTRIKLGEQIRIDYQEKDYVTDTLNAALREPLFITGISHTLRNDGEYQFTVTTRTATDNMVQRFAKLLNFGR